MFFPVLLPVKYLPQPSLHFHFSHKPTLTGGQGRDWHPHCVDGDAEAEPPHGKVSPGSSLSASGLHRVTFCCQVPLCAEAGAASDKLPRAFWSRIRSELWLRQDEWVGECGCP